MPAVPGHAGPGREDDRRPAAVKPAALAVVSAVAVVWLVPAAAGQSLTYSRGQNVAPAYEGWEQDADGTKYFLFGYMNRNWEEELDVPVGAGNNFSPGTP